MANFGNYPGDFRLLPGDQEIRPRIWSLPDYARELTALLLAGKKQHYLKLRNELPLNFYLSSSPLLTSFTFLSPYFPFAEHLQGFILWGKYFGNTRTTLSFSLLWKFFNVINMVFKFFFCTFH